MQSDTEFIDEGYTQPTAESLWSRTPPASSAQSSQSKPPASLTPTSIMPESTAQSSNMSEPPRHVSYKAALLSSNNADVAELQHGSCSTADPGDSQHASDRPLPPRRASSAAPDSTASGAPSQYPDTHNRSIIAASATLTYLQNKCGKGKSPADRTDNNPSTKVKALTSLCKGLLRRPDESIAISADVFQNEIVLAVAHDDGSCIPPETGTDEGEQPEKYESIPAVKLVVS